MRTPSPLSLFLRTRSPIGFATALAGSCAVAAATGLGACGSDSDSSTFDGGGAIDGSRSENGDDGSSGNGDDDGSSRIVVLDGSANQTVSKLAFSPASATVTVDGTSAKNVKFTLSATFADGSTSAVTPDSIEFDRPDLGTLANGDPVTATAPSPLGLFGGTGTLHAIFKGVEATATLTVQAAVTDYGTGLTSTSGSVVALNGGAGADGGGGIDGGSNGGANLPTDPAANISPLLYPYDQTVFPLGLTAPPIMWNAPQAGDVYRLHFAEKNYVYDSYTTLAALPGSLRIAQAVWDKLTASNDTKTSGDPLAFTLSRWDHATQLAYKSTTATWSIAPESLAGAIYYWTTSNGGSLSRIPPGAGAVPVALKGPSGVNCMGCHAVSADGSTLVAALEGGGIPSGADDSRSWVSFDLNAANPDGGANPPVRKLSSVAAGNVAVSPDGKYVLSGDKTLQLTDSKTAAVLTDTSAIPLATNMTGYKSPAFSPDGTLVAAVESGGDWQYWNYSQTIPSELVLLSFNASTKTFGTMATEMIDSSYAPFATGQKVINYPSFAPDSKSVAFQVADHNSGCWTYPSGCETTTTEVGSIWLQSTSSATPVRLTNLSDPPLMTDRGLALEPTFNPTERGGYFWLVFSSERSWGNVALTTSGVADNDKKRLWVSAIDPKTGAAADPSHPAFFLEGQDVTTQNMRGFWTTSSCIATPGSITGTRLSPIVKLDSDGGSGGDGGKSDAGSGSVADGGAAGACVNGFDCCSGFCESGVCIDPSALACAGLGGTCQSVNDCCNGSAVDCVSGVCTARGVR